MQPAKKRTREMAEIVGLYTFKLDCRKSKTDFRLPFGTVHFLFSLQGVVYSRPQQR